MSPETGIPQALLITGIGWLDALPDGIRALLAAMLLAAALAFADSRIPADEHQLGQSFRKTALMLLMLVPLFVWLVPASRMVVFVEALPAHVWSARPFWIAAAGTWLVGTVIALGVLIRRYVVAKHEIQGLPPVAGDTLQVRLRHWQTRLGMRGTFKMLESPGETPRFLGTHGYVLLPAAARHWPGNQQDVLMINALCRLQRHQDRWDLLARIVTCLYWPVPWVRRLHAQLLRDFEQRADELAESCYQDKLGYTRALRQLGTRLSPPRQRRADRHGSRLSGLAASARNLFVPMSHPAWEIDALLAGRSNSGGGRLTDPYDKVVVVAGLAAFLSILVTGVTLVEQPPKIEDRYEMPFGLFWKEHFHRNLELRDKVAPHQTDDS
jgi:hypothetical protein